MRHVLLATWVVAAPGIALAQPLCSVPISGDAPPLFAHPAIALPPPTPASTPAPPPVTQAAPTAAAAPAPSAEAGTAQPTAAALQAIPVLRHIAAAGAQLEDLGERGGLRMALARTGEEFMVLFVAPDGQAAVSGLMADMSLDQLRRVGGAGFIDLGERHGLRGAVLRSGTVFQVFYATPDGSRVIPGVMWDAAGRNVTRDDVSGVPGAIPTVTIGEVPPQAPGGTPAARGPASAPAQPAAAPAPRAEGAAVGQTFAGTLGNPAAPELRMFVDPQCGYSAQAMQRLQPLVASGAVRLSVIPIAILDRRNSGASTRASLAMLSRPVGEMVPAWSHNDLAGPPAAEASGRLQANLAAAGAIGLRGTPTFLWRRADGTEGRQDGLPSDVAALVASVAAR
jgi:thiol:disulfide interchange protein DsbG